MSPVSPWYYFRSGCKDGTVPCSKSGTVYLINVPRLMEKLDAAESNMGGRGSQEVHR